MLQPTAPGVVGNQRRTEAARPGLGNREVSGLPRRHPEERGPVGSNVMHRPKNTWPGDDINPFPGTRCRSLQRGHGMVETGRKAPVCLQIAPSAMAKRMFLLSRAVPLTIIFTRLYPPDVRLAIEQPYRVILSRGPKVLVFRVACTCNRDHWLQSPHGPSTIPHADHNRPGSGRERRGMAPGGPTGAEQPAGGGCCHAWTERLQRALAQYHYVL